MDAIALARAFHVIAVVIWIGGVAMATTVAIPAVRRGDLGHEREKAFQAIERRFIWQARAAVIVVGLTGGYLTSVLGMWERFRYLQFWWMHAMVGVWLLFLLLLFVAEPLILHRHFERWAATAPERAFAWLQRAHWLLLALALITVFGATAGSHGGRLF